jgi:methylated-DNA-[protein]-cysteine S-methyltransferase
MTKSKNQFAVWLGDAKGAPTPDVLSDSLDALYAATPDPARAEGALRAALAQEAGPPIYYDLIDDTALGPVWVASGPHGLVAVEYGAAEAGFRNYLAKVSNNLQRSAEKVATAKAAVRNYIAGVSTALNLEVDLSAMTPFQRSVLEETRKVPRGQVSTYAEIARRIGNPKAVRAVGQALRRNPIPIVVPCHRVIASDGSLGGYGGNLRDKRKIQLLQLEGAMLA